MADEPELWTKAYIASSQQLRTTSVGTDSGARTGKWRDVVELLNDVFDTTTNSIRTVS